MNIYKMEVTKEYNADKNCLAAKYLDGDTPYIGEQDWIGKESDEKYFFTFDEANKALLTEQEKRLEYLSDINNLLDELYLELDGDKSVHVKLYGEAIKRFKEKNRSV